MRTPGALIAAALWLGQACAQPLLLVTEAEAKDSIAAGGMMIPRVQAQPGAPQIELIAPDLKRPVSVPAKIEVRFRSIAPAEPRPETFRVQYGAFRLDITQRLLGVAKVTKEGINVSEAVLPAGRHQLLLTLTDTLGRESQQFISFMVQ